MAGGTTTLITLVIISLVHQAREAAASAAVHEGLPSCYECTNVDGGNCIAGECEGEYCIKEICNGTKEGPGRLATFKTCAEKNSLGAPMNGKCIDIPDKTVDGVTYQQCRHCICSGWSWCNIANTKTISTFIIMIGPFLTLELILMKH